MVKEKMNYAGQRIEELLRGLCGKITPDKRAAVILTMMAIFGLGTLYITISSIYNFGKDNGNKMKIEHIERLEFELQKRQRETDSLKHSKELNYERNR